jgi:hypothetical protein
MDTNVISRIFPDSSRNSLAFGEDTNVASVGDFGHAMLSNMAGGLVGPVEQSASSSNVSF